MIASRPPTWGVAIAPVITGLAIALSDTGLFNPFVALLTALLAVLMQVISNLENDAGYTKRKAERSNRKGLPRATSLGLLTIRQVETAIVFLGVIALAITLYFIFAVSWVFLAITLSSIAAAYLYMGGPKPIAYTPFGEVVVLLFFGLIAIGGTYYLQVQTLSTNIIVVGAALGLIASAVLLVNNYRDRIHDQSINRKTLVVVLGTKKSELVYQFMLFAPYALITALVMMDVSRWPYLFVLASLPSALTLPNQLKTKEGIELNAVLFSTVKLELRFALTLTLGALAHWAL
ncbi:MAG: 1,4-dihydroxy-2-naphthoate octaprenyltransferase [Burkholderiaceae bacterium]|nr:1,4-dihydroxy-2-naphthoate octaprenyltransferase [Burkholderiaceae bacterium]